MTAHNRTWSKDMFILLKESDVKYVPCSGLAGENLTQPCTVEPFRRWYTGQTLLEVIGKENIK